jgi:hypothetical protein
MTLPVIQSIVSDKWPSSNDNLVWFCFVKKSLRKVVVTRSHQSKIDRQQYSGQKEKGKNTIKSRQNTTHRKINIRQQEVYK